MILRRIPGERFSEVVRAWEGETAVLIGGGPSLTLDQVALVGAEHKAGRLRCVAVNDSYLWCGWADLSYFADSHYWEDHHKGIAKPALGLSASEVRERFASFSGAKCSIQNSGANIRDDSVHILRNKTFPSHGDGLSLDPGALATGRNSAYQANNLLILAGVTTIILLGIDGMPAQDGRTHWSGGHRRETPPEAYREYRRAWAEGAPAIAAAGVRVINASPGSAVTAFEKMALEDALDLAVA